MKPIVHIANTDVEFEYARSSTLSLEQSWHRHPICLQLQFLPLLYSDPDDIVVVTALPPQEYLKQMEEWFQRLPRICLFHEKDFFKNKLCQSWGPSLEVQKWAEKHRMTYHLPHDWEMIRLINSKAFSFRYTCLKDAALLYHERELIHWFDHHKGPIVLKTCFGLSGKGNRVVYDLQINKEILNFCQKEWSRQRPILVEPWLDRIVDFSTQWFIHPNQNIDCIGSTRFKTDSQGSYLGTFAGPENSLFFSDEEFLREHKKIALKALVDMASMGFFGFVGIDALLYRHPNTHAVCLYPIVEINGRQTMSLVALRLQQRLSPRKILFLQFHHNTSPMPSFLPQSIQDQSGKMIHFQRKLILQLDATI